MTQKAQIPRNLPTIRFQINSALEFKKTIPNTFRNIALSPHLPSEAPAGHDEEGLGRSTWKAR